MEKTRLKQVGKVLGVIAVAAGIFWPVWDHFHPKPDPTAGHNAKATGDHSTSVAGDVGVLHNETYVVNPPPATERIHVHNRSPAISFLTSRSVDTPYPDKALVVTITALADIARPTFELRCNSPCILTQVTAVDSSTNKQDFPPILVVRIPFALDY